jgi:YbgC/YbaW family acyl-CoA thioester hydrolase
MEYIEIIKPRISDINYGNHVGHIELLNLLHEVRMQFLKKYHLNEIEMEGCALMVRELKIKYINQSFWNDELKIHLELKESRAKIIFNYSIHNLSKNNLTGHAEIIMLLINKNTQKPLKPHIFFDKINNRTIS